MKALAIAGIFASLIHGQATTPLTFEVASVKPSTSGFNGVRGGCRGIDSSRNPNSMAATTPLGRCVITDGRLSHLIAIAFEVASIGSIKNAPDWVIGGDERFTIEAKAEDPMKATEQQLLQMLRALLVERFQLKFHIENRDVPGFALVVGRNGPKLQEAKADETGMDFGVAGKPSLNGPISVNLRKYSMQTLAHMLSQIGPGPVIDKTELKGSYDFKLSWDETAGPSLSTALQEQLGLRFESQKVPVSYFVIESAERPQKN